MTPMQPAVMAEAETRPHADAIPLLADCGVQDAARLTTQSPLFRLDPDLVDEAHVLVDVAFDGCAELCTERNFKAIVIC